MTREEDIRSRAIGLFTFLRGMAELKNPPVRTVEAYEQDGEVQWLGALPAHDAVRSAHRHETLAEGIWIEVDKLDPIPPPRPPAEILDRVRVPAVGDLHSDPELLPDRDAPVDWDDEQMVAIPRPDPARPIFDDWVTTRWRAWQLEEQAREPVRELYRRLFRINERTSYDSEGVELLLTVGCLGWQPFGHEPVRRHLVVVPAEVTFDQRTGRLSVLPAADADPRIELDMLDPQHRPRPELLDGLDDELNEALAGFLDESAIGPILRRIANVLDPSSHYLDALAKPDVGDAPQVAFAPALIMRRRSSADQVRIFDTILESLATSSDVPAGIRQLVDEDAGTHTETLADEPVFHLPLPANDEQLEIVRRVATRPFTIVQGPPGTGKTHTIANLLSHLLAEGKRVLVTAETDRALRELRDKLPDPLKTLCVSVVGTDRDDRNSLKVAIDTLASQAASFDAGATQRRIDVLRQRVQELEAEREALTERLITIRGEEAVRHEVDGYAGTLAEMAVQREQERDRHGWIEDLAPDLSTPAPPITEAELAELRELWRDGTLQQDEEAARLTLPDPDQLIEPLAFQAHVQEEAQAQQHAESLQDLRTHAAYPSIAALADRDREDLAAAMRTIAVEARELSARREAWITAALDDVYLGRPQEWQTRYEKLSEYAGGVAAALQQIPLHVRVVQHGTTPPGQLRRQAQALSAHLAAGGRLKGILGTPRPVKEAAELLAEVTVNDLKPDTPESCRLVDAWFDIADRLGAMDRLWPKDVQIPEEDTPHERLGWQQAEIHVLGLVLDLARRVLDLQRRLGALKIPQPDWTDLTAVASYADVVEAANTQERLAASRRPLEILLAGLRGQALTPKASPTCDALVMAIENRDVRAYAKAHDTLRHLIRQRGRLARRDALDSRLRAQVPALADRLAREPHAPVLDTMGSGWDAPWRWARLARWIADQVSTDGELVQRRLHDLDRELERYNGELTAALAWQRAIARLDHRQQSNLRAYANAANKIPKTRTAKTRPQRLRDAQRALRACRQAVPSWVMPLYRIAESMDILQDSFDVVIIDEASQADTGASFLQFLAPQVVVVGDDEQVSPTAVGIDEGNVQKLRQTHLAGVPHEAVWADAHASYFEICDVYFADRVTLREHFRCMPEIIGFSNEICYEPRRVPLLPLRQFGVDRLPPVRTLFVPDGWEDRQVNRPEAIAVAELIQKLLADPAYDGKTFGVITLVGTRQHRLIEQELLARIEPEEYRARDLRCGIPPDFQGSERDVIVLSMVAAPKDSGRMPVARTTKAATQRYNVAASRAKDQMWVVHSVEHTALRNREDLRYKLLAYCESIMAAESEETGGLTDPVPEDRLVAPFDELFEQQVCNAIIRRGYRVQPKFDLYGHTIDLVVLGDGAKLAVECDGESWPGPEAFADELRRQRQLERCGWPVVRVRRSLFAVDPRAALASLWEALAERGIRPRRGANVAEIDDSWDSHPGTAEAGGGQVVAPTVGTDREDPGAALTGGSSLPSPPELQEAPPLLHVVPAAPATPANEDVPPRETVGPQSERSLPSPSVPVPPPNATLVPEVPSPFAVDELPPPPVPTPPVTAPVPVPPTPAELGGELRLAPYVTWIPRHPVKDAHSATREEIVDVLVDIVGVEGPLVGERLFQLYVKGSGGQRVGGEIKRILNSAASRAERRGDLIGEDPLGLGGQKWRTYRLPDQPESVLREIGERGSLSHIPPREIREVLDHFRATGLSGEALHRAVLDAYGLKRYTTKTAELLHQIARATF